MQTLKRSSTTSSKHVCTSHCLHEAKGPTSDYWRTPKGITRRIDMLAQGLTYKVVNNSLMFYGYSAGIQWVRWHTMADERVCFPAETLISTDQGNTPIEDIQVGDRVLTRKGLKKVIATTSRPYTGTMVTIEHEAGKLTSTFDHPIRIVGEGWIPAFQIQTGNLLKTVDNKTSWVLGVHQFPFPNSLLVFNLEVEDEPEYFANGVLVHNCPICGPLEGRIYRKGQFLPPLPAHSSCLTPETKVHAENGAIPIIDIRVGDHVLTHKGRYKRVIQLHKNKHEGKIYQISDNRLTGNHPILTPKGWVAIDGINDGEQILCIPTTNGHSNLPPRHLNPNEAPTPASKEVLLSSVKLPLRFARVPITPVNFDGNLNVGDCEVQIIDVERVLGDRQDVCSLEHLQELVLQGGHPTFPLAGDGPLDSLSSGSFAPPIGFVGGAHLCSTSLGAHLTPLESFCFALPSDIHGGLKQAVSDNGSGNPEMLGNGVLGHLLTYIHVNDFIDGQLHPDEDTLFVPNLWHKPVTPTTISTDTYKGFVYNLSVEDDESYVIGEDKIIVHNCRCRWELILTPAPTAPTVDRIILPDAEGYDISAANWQSMVKILSATAISILILTADQTANRVESYRELELMMRNRGYTFILLDIPVDEEERKWWIARGYRLEGNRLVKRIN